MRPQRPHSDRPILITEAPVNANDEFDRRRKRYLVMMGLRALCIVGAATTFRMSGWLAAAFVAAAVVLPWAAVLIANDRPPRQELRFRRFLGSDQAAVPQLPPARPGGPPDESGEAPAGEESQRPGGVTGRAPAAEESPDGPTVPPTVIDI